jgi:hypothetical protein
MVKLKFLTHLFSPIISSNVTRCITGILRTLKVTAKMGMVSIGRISYQENEIEFFTVDLCSKQNPLFRSHFFQLWVVAVAQTRNA